MPEGPLGGPRPLADNEVEIRFSILTTREIANTVDDIDLTGIAEIGISEAVGTGRIDAAIISSADASYDSRTNNLFIDVVFNEVDMTLGDIENFVREFFATLVNVTGSEMNMSLNTQTLDDLPPDIDTFILVDQGGLENNISVRG